ncbi:hypothetical protein, partial [uncultured Prevotella sp.]|uniref:hypothetical protein n=1 Tax=uncultured Prevotella sp. TaxID=159272 RepID=UPI002591E33E
YVQLFTHIYQLKLIPPTGGSYKKRPDHHKVYELVKNESFNPYWKKTTDRYKKKMDEKLKHYNDNEK